MTIKAERYFKSKNVGEIVVFYFYKNLLTGCLLRKDEFLEIRLARACAEREGIDTIIEPMKDLAMDEQVRTKGEGPYER